MAYLKTLEYKVFDRVEQSDAFCKRVDVDVIRREVNGDKAVVFYYTNTQVQPVYTDYYDEYWDEYDNLYMGGETYYRDKDGKWKREKPKKKDEDFYSRLFHGLV